ncbi:hypothetical protein M5689_015722 [Euphorbia peplus]|nr:hypothetical protein M5689_015722 [Euphorbia peplus]
MFRLHKSKHSPLKSGEKISFKFSQFEALQVPKGWEKLLVSIISVETGKTLGKTSKTHVRNGSCQWTDSLSESIWIPKDDQSQSRSQSQSSKELEECLYKFLISMGSGRSGILGEAEVNMATYMSSSDVFPISLPLKKCSHETILLLKIQCLTPRINLRDDASKSAMEDHNLSSEDAEIKSGDSDNTLYSSKDLTSNEDEIKVGAKRAPEEASFGSSGSDHSYNSAENFSEKEIFSSNVVAAIQDSNSSQNSVPPGSSDVDNVSQSDGSTRSDNVSQDDNDPQEFAPAASLTVSGSSRSLLEAAEDTIEDFRTEAKHWERNARKLMLDLEILRKQHSEMSRREVNSGMELSAACAERDCLQKEVEHLKKLMEKASESEIRVVQDNGLVNVVKELENDIRFLKETNDNLTMQLRRSQESNVELVTVLQELEEAAEKQKGETDSVQGNVDNNQQNLHAKVHELEKALERKISAGLESSYQGGDEGLISEIGLLKSKLQELESDCQELTNENLELLLKLKEMKKSSAENGSLIDSRVEGKDHEYEIHELEEKMRKIETDHLVEIQELQSQKSELEGKVRDLNKELNGTREKLERLEADLVSKEEEIGDLRKCQTELEEKLSDLQNEKGKLEVVKQESDIATKCLTDLQNDVAALSSSVSSHVSANKVLQRKSLELENGKRELEVRLSEMEQENEELSGCISMLEAQIRNLSDDRKSIVLELDNFRSNYVTLQDEIARLRNEMQTQETDSTRKLEEIENRCSEAQEELEKLRNANPKLQSTAESLIKNCGSLQNSVRQLRMHNLELQEHCDNLEAKLSDTQRNFSDCSKRVNVLQENICSLVEESTLKERSLTSELDTLVKENDTQNKKIIVLDQMYTEKTAELENLRQELEDLNRELCSTRDEKERLVSASEKEASDLRGTIIKLETDLKTGQIDSKANIEDLMDELASSKQNQQMLKAEMAKISNSLENYRSCEEKFKTTLNSLELKLTLSEYEHQQLTEETTKLKAQLLKMECLEDEVMNLRNEKYKLETSLNQKSEEYEELKVERSEFIEKITDLQKASAELEDCRHDKFVLEERMQQLECSLIANEALSEQDTEVRKELTWIKRSNKQLQQQILQLEEEKQKLKTRTQSLEEDLMLMKERQRSSLNSPSYQHRREGEKLMDDELSKSKESTNAFKLQLKRLASESRKNRTGSPRRSKGEVEFVPKEKFERTKSSLETELREIQERYLDLSLKYAQGEAQREELVMKLKGNNNGRKWF